MNIQIASFRLFFWAMMSSIILFYAIWYTLSSYQDLVIWYQQLNPDFYKNDQWTDIFFTSEVKSFGQIFTWTLVVLSFVFLWISYKEKKINLKSSIAFNHLKITTEGVLIFIFTMLNWYYWQDKASYATDEVFSAVNFAGIPFFQTISHYPLPNNHIFYNAINHWFGYFTDDLVFSGRLISGIFIGFMMVSIHSFSASFIRVKAIRILIILLLLTVFPIIGFATQARGYSLHMLLGWIAFLQLYLYSSRPDDKHMIFYIAANALGMWTMPSYLYYWAGLTLAFGFIMIRRSKLDYRFFFSSVKILVLVFIFYLPVVTFSGWSSIIANKYVTSGQEGIIAFLQSMFSGGYFQGLFSDFFGTGQYTWIGFGVILFTLFLSWFNRKKAHFGPYLMSLIIVLLVMFVLHRKMPFYRNLVSHGVMIWVLLLLTIGVIIDSKRKLYTYIFSACLIVISGYFTYLNLNKYPFHLYYYDVNGFGNSLSQYDVSGFKNRKVFIHDESFYWHTAVRKATDDIHLGGIIDQNADVIIIDSSRTNLIDTSKWTLQGELGESQIWGI